MKPKKERKPKAAVNGMMSCLRGHKWDVADFNVEREAVNCPVCGNPTKIEQGLEKK